jgi:hypothetical protein
MTFQRVLDNLFPFERPATRGDLLFFRVFEALIIVWTLNAAWFWAPSFAYYTVVVGPLGLANFMDISVFFNPVAAYGLVTALTVSLVLGFFRRWRWAYFVALLLFHLAFVARYSLGEISHGSHFPGLAILALALGTTMYRTPAVTYRFVFGMIFFLYGLGYTCAGFCKLIATGLGWPAAQHLALWMGERMIDVTSSFGVFEPNLMQRFVVAYPAVGSVALAFGWVAEFAGVLMWFERARPYVLTALILMHLGVEFLLNIFFAENIYILVLLAYPWPRLLDWAFARFGGKEQPASSVAESAS